VNAAAVNQPLVKKGRVRAILNPSARSGRARRALARWRELEGVTLEWVVSESPAHLRRLVREAQEDELDAVLLAGGDGTVRLAADALDAGHPVPLAILPVGSGNDFARELGVTRATDPRQLLSKGVARAVDVGRVTPGGARFCCVASVGFDSTALELIHGSWLPRSKLLNTVSALRALWRTEASRVRVTWEGGSFEGPAMLVAATNTRSYGGGFLLTPDARTDDGQLDVCVIGDIGRLRMVLEFPRIFAGTHGGRPGVTLARSPWVRIESLGAPLPVCLDGELASHTTPVELRCEPGAVRALSLVTS
jgi:diacylglycerol kinase (ATP)